MNEPTRPTTAEDTEAHVARCKAQPAPDAEVGGGDDTEAHGFRREPTPGAEASDADDTEAHGFRREPLPGAEDVEGHAFVLPEERPLVGDHRAPSSTDAAEGEGDDTDGHGGRFKF